MAIVIENGSAIISLDRLKSLEEVEKSMLNEGYIVKLFSSENGSYFYYSMGKDKVIESLSEEIKKLQDDKIWLAGTIHELQYNKPKRKWYQIF